MRCGEKIKYYRELICMSQSELAQRTGYAGRSAISRIEKGERDLSQTKIKMFARVLGVDPIKLLDDREPDPIVLTTIEPERKQMLSFIEHIPGEQLDIYRIILSLPYEKLESIVELFYGK